MNEFSTIPVEELKEDKILSQLVPEMTVAEYERFIDSVKSSGINTPIHINNDMTILDGRHRVRACKELGIREIDCLVHDFDKTQAINFVRDTAIERRNLTPAQRADIVLRSSDLVESIEAKARENQKEYYGNQYKKVDSWSVDHKSTTVNKRKQLADIAGVGESTMKRMMRAKKEDEQLYERVVSGDISPRKSDDILRDRKKSNVKKVDFPKPKPMSEDERKLFMAIDNMDLNFNQIIYYVKTNQEKLYEAICDTYDKRYDFMEEAYDAMTRLITLMETCKGEIKNDKNIQSK